MLYKKQFKTFLAVGLFIPLTIRSIAPGTPKAMPVAPIIPIPTYQPYYKGYDMEKEKKETMDFARGLESIFFVTDKLGNIPLVKMVGEKTGIHSKTVSLSTIVPLTADFFSLTFVLKLKELGESYQIWTLKKHAQTIGASSGISLLVLNENSQNILQKTPCIGKYITCSNSDCKDVCDNCLGKKMLTTILISAGVFYLSSCIK